MNRSDIVRRGYNRIAEQYLASRTQDSEDVQLLHRLTDQLPQGARILDAGCGAGVPIARKLSERYDVVGVDFAATQVKLACKLVPKAHFECQDMTALTFPDGIFDAVCSYYAIIHIPRESHERVFRQFFRVLKPDGLALLCLGASNVEADFDEDYHGVKMYWSHFDAETNLKLLERSGLETMWSKLVVDASWPTSKHLFVLARKSGAL
jgi:SAM-dependent methyltransferase